MFTTPAFAQTLGTGGGPMDTFPLVMLMVLGIVFFLVIRPQQQKAKEFASMIDKVRRGDTVVTAGGFVGRVSKVTEGSDDVEVELNEQMKVRVLKSTLLSVRAKNEPVKETA
jgi:preprotein translocase subunit YajC